MIVDTKSRVCNLAWSAPRGWELDIVTYGEGYVFRVSVLLLTGGRGLGIQESAQWAHCCYKSAHAHGGGVRESALWAHCCYKSAHAHGGVCPGKCTLSTLLLEKCTCPWRGGGCPEKCIMSTFLLLARGMQLIFELPSFIYIKFQLDIHKLIKLII